jgi:transcriptional regulator with GAF, ATPase, and Fis domain
MFDEYLFTQGENAPIPLPLPKKAYSDDIMSLVEALKRHNGARRGAAKELGISLRTLQYRLKKHRITVKPASQVFIEDKSL